MSQMHGCVSSPLLARVLLSRVLWRVAAVNAVMRTEEAGRLGEGMANRARERTLCPWAGYVLMRRAVCGFHRWMSPSLPPVMQ